MSIRDCGVRRSRAGCLALALLAAGPWLAAAAGQAETNGAVELGPEDAVAAALANEPRLKAAAQRWEAARARRANSEWNRLGQLETSFLYTPEQRPLQIEFPGIPPYVPPTSFEVRQLSRYSAGATLTQPIWTWGALASQRGAARSEERASRSGLTRAQQETSFEARRSYLLATTAAAAVEVGAQSLSQQRAFLELAQARERAGAAPRLDVLKAELAAARAEAELSQTRHADRLAREALVTVTLDERFRSAGLRQPAEGRALLPAEEEAVAAATRRRPDLSALSDQADAWRLGARATAAASRPALALRASITQQNDLAGDVFKKRSQLYQAGLVVSWDAFAALRSHSKLAELRANERGARETARAALEGVALEVRSALLSVREARERVDVEARALTVAEEQARVARLAYREGLITSVEAQDAELALTAARFALLRARHDGALAEARLTLATGE